MEKQDTIKTYEQVNREDASAHFRVAKMEDYYELRNGKVDAPHRHNYYTVLLVKKASGRHIIDFKEYELTGDIVFFVNPGQVHQVIEYEKSYGYILTFSTQFLIDNNIPLSFIEDLNLFNDYGVWPPMNLDDNQRIILENHCEEILGFYHSNIKFKNHAIGASLKLFLIYCNNLCTLSKEDTQIIQAGHSILKNFKKAVEQNYIQWHSSAEYAQYLNISTDHLNRTIKSLIGKTAKDYIQTRICIAAKRLLYFSDLTTKEIAYKLGFSEASNFSAFFKKCAGISPSEFRKKR